MRSTVRSDVVSDPGPVLFTVGGGAGLNLLSSVQGDLEKTSAVEGSVMDCVLAMVMKLSEVTFRPLFFKVTDGRPCF